MKIQRIASLSLGGALMAGALGGMQTAAKADTTSTAAIAAGAAAIVGALLYDSSNHPYYVNNNHRYYVTQNEAAYYKSHHHGVMRNAYVPETEYPVSRDPYHPQNNQHGHDDHHH